MSTKPISTKPISTKTMPTRREWLERLSGLNFRHHAYIHGEFVKSTLSDTFECINPANGQPLINVTHCRQGEVEEAVRDARAAFESGAWSASAPSFRKSVLLKLSSLILQHQEELALLETLDMGKPVRDSLRGDIPSAARCIAWHAEAIDKMYGEVAPTPSHILGLITREPLGVVGAIVPWNFPLLMACWKVGPALACGNSVVLKPSEKSPLTALRLAELATEAGVPDGVFNVIPGFGDTTGKALALHNDVDCIAFTGSTAVGKKIIEYAGQSNMKQTFMECGGKSPNLIFADCSDIDKVGAACANAIFYNQGEVCTAASRLIVEESIKDQIVAKIVEASQRMFPGDPLEESSYMGAIVDDIQMQRVLGYIESATAEGALLRAGGKRVLQETGGYYIEPTVFDGVSSSMKLFREEVFGPVLAVTTFSSEEEAIRLANDTQYGLAGAVWTQNINRAHRVARAIRAGTVCINAWDGGDMTMPFGGFKQSGNGRDKSLHAMEKYTGLKSTWINLA